LTCRSRQSSERKNQCRVWVALVLAACLSGFAPNFAVAQANTFSLPEIPVLTIERERLFTETLFGQSLSKEIATRGRRLSAENRRIENELADEESELTALRETLEAAEFRDLADAFDLKVTTARTEQDSKARELSQLSEQVERRFLFAIAPVMERLMSEKGASVILDRRAVFVSADSSDITVEAVQRIDLALGEGMALQDLLQHDISTPLRTIDPADPADPAPALELDQ